MKKLLVIEAAALGWKFFERHGAGALNGLAPRPLQTVFPALTCTVQATLRTGLPPAGHGVLANGFYDKTLRKAMFWEQSSALADGNRIWQDFRYRGGTVGLAFFQQSLGEQADLVLSPAPVHTHGGGMLMTCASRPADLYRKLCAAVGSPFRLHRYWGPLASAASSAWIAQATAALLASSDAPDLCFTYLPGLDYDLQRHGPDHPKSAKALKQVCAQAARLMDAARARGYEVVLFGDYAITPADRGPLFPNRILREAGLFAARAVKDMLYPDFHQSRAFTLVDHQIAWVHCADPADIPPAAAAMRALDGMAYVHDRAAQAGLQVNHPRGGDILLVAKPGHWFAYPWWTDPRHAPDFASHVDIHNKPGYDPCELFFGRTPFRTSVDPARVKGTHGLTGPGFETALFSSLPFKAESVEELANEIKDWLRQRDPVA